MARSLAALVTLSLLCVGANAAHKSGGGALHLVALANVNSTISSTVANQTLFQTNGNGTWYSGAYANTAFTTAANYTGALGAFTSAFTNTLGAFNGAFAGLQDLVFPSHSLGIAVGLSAPGNTVPTILTTVDAGTSWQRVTGFVGPSNAGLNLSIGKTAPDLSSVVCVSRSLCIAVGGYDSYPAVSTFGAVYASTNGGTVWSGISIPLVSYLYSVDADSSGRHVYAVGAPAVATNYSLTSFQGYIPFAVSAGTIIFSGDFGVHWAAQTAPVIMNYNYQLYAVKVLRGTIAFAAGGRIPGVTTNSNGIILGTANGGFTWVQQAISLNASPYVNGVASTAMTLGTVPVIEGLGFNVLSGSGNYTGWAVTNTGLVLRTVMPTATLHSIQATYFSVVWSQYALSSTLPQAAQALYGITWDSNTVGYLYGAATLVSTHDGGMSWYSEVPAAAVLNGDTFVSIASVPTTY